MRHVAIPRHKKAKSKFRTCGSSHNFLLIQINVNLAAAQCLFILTWRGRGSCSPKRVINKARRLIEYTALHAAVCGRLWLQLRLYVRRRIFARVGLCACRRPRTKPIKLNLAEIFLKNKFSSFDCSHKRVLCKLCLL